MLPELEAAQVVLNFLHRQVKNQLTGLDEEGLNWLPEGVEGVNSIYGLALHLANSQVTFAGALAGERLSLEIPELKEGGSVFKLHGTSAEQAESVLQQAAEITSQVFEKLTVEQLLAETTLPGGGKGIGHNWVQLMLSHTGEHLGHISLTRQLYQSRHQV